MSCCVESFRGVCVSCCCVILVVWFVYCFCCSVASVCHCVGVLSRVVLWCCVVVVLCCCSGVLHCPDVVLVVVMLFMSVFDLYVCWNV